MKTVFHIIILSFVFFSCANNPDLPIAFYHWKAKAEFPVSYKNTLAKTQTDTLYLHYFDIKLVNKKGGSNDGIYPVYLLKEVDKAYTDFTIIPVIYIENQIFKQQIDTKGLVERTHKLIHQISNKHFGKEITNIQIDCDWTRSTKNAYFEFLTLLAQDFELSATIRLHQIKFKNKTGVPPVKKGTLMLYNVGDLKNKQQNSILENSIVKQYINSETDYPLPLNIGLPLFSQTIITNKDNKIKIIKSTNRDVLEHDTHFKKIDKTNFTVIKDTLYKGFYLSKDYNLKLEELAEEEIISSYKTIKNSKLHTKAVVFYHLDETAITTIDLEKIIDAL